MSRPREATRLADEVRQAAARPGAARTLLLDVDGTLAPIAPTPEQALVPPSALLALDRLLQQGWTVVAVSGRPAAEVRRLVPVRGVHAFGSHGIETPESHVAATLADGELQQRLRRLAASGSRLADEFPGVRVERKTAGIAFHDRALRPAALARWRAALAEWLAGRDLSGLETLSGKRVLEIRPLGAHKGRVVRRLAEKLQLGRYDASFVAVGDDVTDEDMFREIRDLGLGVRVGADEAATEATRRLGSPREVAAFLTELASAPSG